MNIRPWIVAQATVVIVSFIVTTDAKLVQGNLLTDKTWKFLRSFLVKDNKSGFSYHFLYPVSYGTQKVLLYHDEQWPSVYNTNKNCTEKMSVLNPQNHQIIALNTSYTLTSRYSGCNMFQQNGENFYNCTGRRTFKQSKPRCWYIVIARCSSVAGSVQGLKLTYTMDVPAVQNVGRLGADSCNIAHAALSNSNSLTHSQNVGALVIFFSVMISWLFFA